MTQGTEIIKRKALELIIKDHPAKFSGMSFVGIYADTMKEYVDWHVFSEYFDYLRNVGILALVGHNNDGCCQYSLKGS